MMPFDEHPRRRIRLETNSLGLRGRAEVAAIHPDLRVLVTGDSHADGVCDPEECFAHLIGQTLSAERPAWTFDSLNAAVGGYSFYHYLGALERLLPTAPDVLVVCVYGGNDFVEPLLLRAAFEHLRSPASHSTFRAQLDAALEASSGAVLQGLSHEKYLLEHPNEIPECIDMAAAVSREILEYAEAKGVRVLFAYLPPVHDVQWARYEGQLRAICEKLEMSVPDRSASGLLADRWMDELRRYGGSVLDLRSKFREADYDLYWRSDLHINLAAHRLIAQELTPFILAQAPSVSRNAGKTLVLERDSTADEVRGANFVGVADDPLPSLRLERSEVARWVPPELGATYSADTLLHAGRSVAFTPARESEHHVVLIGDELAWPDEESDDSLAYLVGSALERLHSPAKVSERLTAFGEAHTALLQARQSELRGATTIVFIMNANNDFEESLALADIASRPGAFAPQAPEGTAFEPEQQWLRSALSWKSRPKALRNAARTSARALLEFQSDCALRGQSLLLALAPSSFANSCAEVEAAATQLADERGLPRSVSGATFLVAASIQQFASECGLDWVELPQAGESECLQNPATFRLNAAGRRALAERIAEVLASRR